MCFPISWRKTLEDIGDFLETSKFPQNYQSFLFSKNWYIFGSSYRKSSNFISFFSSETQLSNGMTLMVNLYLLGP